jgi:hypothetical protein
MNNLIERKGNVITALKMGRVDFIMHCVNCQGVMNSGIAAEVKAEYPEVFAKYESLFPIEQSSELLGHVQVVNGVINIFAQDNYGRETRHFNYGAFLKGLLALITNSPLISHSAFGHNKVVIGVPKLIGCDRAGGNWEVVSEILQGMPDWIEIIVYDYN